MKITTIPAISGVLLGGALGVLQIVIRNYDLCHHDSWLYGQLGDFTFLFLIFSLVGIFFQLKKVVGKIWLALAIIILIAGLSEEIYLKDRDDQIAYIMGAALGILCAYPCMKFPQKKIF